jgi:hypothetical protein
MDCTLNIADAIQQVFGIPAVEVMSQAFAVGLMPPLTFYLVGYCVGVLVNFWNK